MGNGPSLRGNSAFLVFTLGIMAATGPLQADVDDAIGAATERGVAYLLKAIEARQVEVGYPDFDKLNLNMGNIAFDTYALIVAGVGVEHQIVRKNFEDMARMKLDQVYSIAAYVFALDAAIGQLQADAAITRPGRKPADDPAIGAAYRARLEEGVNALVRMRLKTGGWDYGTYYPPQWSRFDNSNVQFAVLALGVGLKRGVPIAREVWIEVADHLLRWQGKDGPEVKERLEFIPEEEAGEGKRGGKKDGKKGKAEKKAGPTKALKAGNAGAGSEAWRARGWGYMKDLSQENWNMTYAGLSSMVIARMGLGDSMDPDLDRQTAKSIRDGYAWIMRNWEPRGGGWVWAYYSFYSLEKVGDLDRVRRLGVTPGAEGSGHDWYREIRKIILAEQQPDGSWPGMNKPLVRWNTDFALLVLNRATALVLQGRDGKRFARTGLFVRREEGSDERTWVYVREHDRELHVPTILRHIRLRPTALLLDLLKLVLKGFPPQDRGLLVADLARTRDVAAGQKSARPIQAFLEEQLHKITGLKSATAGDHIAWHKTYTDLDRIGKEAKDPAGCLAKTYPETVKSPALKRKLIWAALRCRSRDCAPFLLGDLRSADADVRAEAHAALSRIAPDISREDFPAFDAKAAQAARDAQVALVEAWFRKVGGDGDGRPAASSRGIAVLSSTIGREVPASEIEAFARTCRMDLVAIDFAWITAHWERTDLDAISALCRRLRAQGVGVAAMYRPRLLRPGEAEVHMARDEAGKTAGSHNHLCFAHEDSVRWGASWGTKILEKVSEIDLVVIYNLVPSCRCDLCREDGGARHASAFLRACRKTWAAVRPTVRIGHVGMGAEQAADVDLLLPFLALNRESAGAAPDVPGLFKGIEEVKKAARGKPVLPLVKVCWAAETRNDTGDVIAAVRGAEDARTGFLLWYYDWILHPDGGRYDPPRIVSCLGGDPEALFAYLPTPKPKTAEDPEAWISIASRESGAPPRLVLVGEAGDAMEIRADADTTLISYLADKAFGSEFTISVNLNDTNRGLIRFAVPGGAKFVRAELRLLQQMFRKPPRNPYVLAVHRIEDPWEEESATWKKPPAFAPEPAATVTARPKDGPIVVDVTGLAKGWASGKVPNHGILIKPVAPPGASPAPARTPPGSAPGPDDPAAGPESARGADLPPQRLDPGYPAPSGVRLIEEALGLWPWAADVPGAFARARREGKPVLAVVTAGFDHERITAGEEFLLATALSWPAVVRLASESFVPVRVKVDPGSYMRPGSLGPDPVAPLGTRLPDARPPAIVIVSPDGRHAGTLASIGSFDPGAVLRFLRGTQQGAVDGEGAKDGAPAGALSVLRLGRRAEAARALEACLSDTGEGRDEAAWWLALLLRSEGRREEASKALAGIALGSPWSLPARIQEARPNLLLDAACMSAPALATIPPRGEVKVPPDRVGDLVRIAVRRLLELQKPDGSWPVPGDDALPAYAPGVAVLAAHALLVWLPDLPEDLRSPAGAALDRADRWLGKNIAAVDPAVLNSFAAAYYLDYLLDARAARRAEDGSVRRAVAQLLGGQCPSGAWSYDRRFGKGWRGGIGFWPATDKGRAHSVNTGLALAALLRAKAAGFAVDRAALESGRKALLAMRGGPAKWTYTWPEPRCFEEVDSSSARAPLCEMALLRMGEGSKDDLRRACDVFMARRGDLRRATKVSESWLPPHGFSSYFYFFALLHGAQALAELGGDAAKGGLMLLRRDLLSCVEPDGTWIDFPALGRSYGTAMALRVLKLAEPAAVASTPAVRAEDRKEAVAPRWRCEIHDSRVKTVVGTGVLRGKRAEIDNGLLLVKVDLDGLGKSIVEVSSKSGYHLRLCPNGFATGCLLDERRAEDVERAAIEKRPHPEVFGLLFGRPVRIEVEKGVDPLKRAIRVTCEPVAMRNDGRTIPGLAESSFGVMLRWKSPVVVIENRRSVKKDYFNHNGMFLNQFFVDEYPLEVQVDGEMEPRKVVAPPEGEATDLGCKAAMLLGRKGGWTVVGQPDLQRLIVAGGQVCVGADSVLKQGGKEVVFPGGVMTVISQSWGQGWKPIRQKAGNCNDRIVLICDVEAVGKPGEKGKSPRDWIAEIDHLLPEARTP